MTFALALLTLVAWFAIGLALYDIYRIKRYGYVKSKHLKGLK